MDTYQELVPEDSPPAPSQPTAEVPTDAVNPSTPTEEIIQVPLTEEYQHTPPEPREAPKEGGLGGLLARLTGNRLNPNQASAIFLLLLLAVTVGLIIHWQSLIHHTSPLVPVEQTSI